MRKTHYSRKTRQLKRLIQELKSAQELNYTDAIKRIKFKIKSLIHQLVGVFSKHQLRNILGSAAVVIGLTSISNSAHAQNFAAPIQNAFGITPTLAEFGGLTMADMDGDGDLDIIQGQYYGVIDYFENTGTSTNPAFGTPLSNPFGLVNSMYVSLPTAADMDNDGDVDLLVGEVNGSLTYFENTGTPTAPSFAAPVQSPFGLTATYLIAAPTCADIDNDGDMDVLVGEYYGNLQFFENTGTASTPSFAAPVQNPFGLTSAYMLAFPAFGDLDLDGDLDLLVGEYYGNNLYFENTGTESNPTFANPVSNPFGLVAVYQISCPTMGDLDNDGDLDILVNEYYENIVYFKNTEINASIADLESKTAIYPNPFTTQVTIESELNIERVDIYSIAGQLVKTIEKPSFSLDLRELEPGMYLFNAYANGEIVSTKKLKKQ
jgi:hypothetical protein